MNGPQSLRSLFSYGRACGSLSSGGSGGSGGSSMSGGAVLIVYHQDRCYLVCRVMSFSFTGRYRLSLDFKSVL